MKGKAILLKYYPQVIKNFDSDLYLKDKKKSEFKEFETFIGKDSSLSIKDYIDELNKTFFHNPDYQQIGEKFEILENIGHVVEKEFFFNGFLLSLKNKSKSRMLGAIDNSKLKKRFESKKLPELKVLYPEINIRLYQMWSFRNPGKHVLSGMKKDELSFFLALEDTVLPKFLFVHKLPNMIKSYKPTAFDAGFMLYWKYGGYTNPIGKCKGKGGLEEVVHNSNKIKYIVEIDLIPN